jgi:hypothetical protein
VVGVKAADVAVGGGPPASGRLPEVNTGEAVQVVSAGP